MQNPEDFHQGDLLDRAVDAVLHDPGPDELPSEQVAQLAAAIHLAADQPYPVSLIRRIKNMKSKTKIAAAAAVVIAFFSLIPWIVPGGGTLAFADVAKAISGVRTATWKTTQTHKGPQGKEVQNTGIGMFLAPSHEHTEWKVNGVTTIRIMDGQKNKGVGYNSADKTAIVFEIKGGESSFGRIFTRLRETIREAKNGKGTTEFIHVKRLGVETLDGRRAEVFSIQCTQPEHESETKIWVDQKTSLPLRVEERRGSGKNASVSVMSDFRFNLDLDPTLFSTDVPKGYTLIQTRVDLSKGPLAPLAEILGVAAKANGGMFPPTLVEEECEQRFDCILMLAAARELREQGIDVDYDLNPLMKRNVDNVTKEDANETHSTTGDRLAKLPPELAGAILKMPIAIGLLQVIIQQGDWHYAGMGVKLGTPNRPIFWCKVGEENYQVIYADLSTKEVSPEDVPKVPQCEGTPQPETSTKP